MLSFILLAVIGDLFPCKTTLLGDNTVPIGMPSITVSSSKSILFWNPLEEAAPTLEDTTSPSFTFSTILGDHWI